MKEFESQTGGRYTYVDDIKNLQDLALAFSCIFDACDNFVVSGCELKNGKLSEGYVWLDRKLRYFSETALSSGVNYIYALDGEEKVPYASGDIKVGRKTYGCAAGPSYPSGRQYIQISATGAAKRFREAFFGKYALLNDSANASQTVNTDVTFQKKIEVMGALSSADSLMVHGPKSACKIYCDGDTILIRAGFDNNKECHIVMSDDGNTGYYINGKQILSLGDKLAEFSVPLKTPKAHISSIFIDTFNIYNTGTGTNDGEININVLGHNGTDSFYRTTNIGDGKGNALLSIIGKQHIVHSFCPLKITASEAGCIIFNVGVPYNSASINKYMAWVDIAGKPCGDIGFSSASDRTFALNNYMGDIHIAASTAKGPAFVNIAPAIKEGGALLSEKYVLRSTYLADMDKKANSVDVYDRVSADSRFATLNGGLSQFINKTKSKSVLCGEIGAAQSTDLSNYARLDQLLADMADTDEKKKAIRDQIGAAAKTEVLRPELDSGWINITDSNGQRGLYARQIGKIVCIQGTLTTVHSGTVFNLPASISAPKHDAAFNAPVSSGGIWGCVIPANTKQCKVVFCNSHSYKTSFTLTYMI